VESCRLLVQVVSARYFKSIHASFCYILAHYTSLHCVLLHEPTSCHVRQWIAHTCTVDCHPRSDACSLHDTVCYSHVALPLCTCVSACRNVPARLVLATVGGRTALSPVANRRGSVNGRTHGNNAGSSRRSNSPRNRHSNSNRNNRGRACALLTTEPQI
jgi:hypothetical protein